jgi:serine protease Do
MPRVLLGTLLVWLGMLCAGVAKAQISPEMVARAKAATVLVDTKTGTGSAFCIDRSGLFMTNAHVVEATVAGGTVKIALHPGEKDEKVLTAHILRSDKASDLALLQLDSPILLTELPLGSDAMLVETQSVTAFGYPFGKELAIEKDGYPNITVSTGHITSLRKSKGHLQNIQIDASLNPGNSGGPVLNDKGEVIGVVRAGIEGAGINFAIPVHLLNEFLSAASIVFAPPALTAANVHSAQDFTVTLLDLGKAEPDLHVALTLSTGENDHRAFEMTPSDSHHYHIKAAPAPIQGTSLLRLTLHTGDSDVVCKVEDQIVTVGGKKLRLSQIRRIEQNGGRMVTQVDGSQIIGTIAGLEAVATKIAGQPTHVNLNRIAEVTVESDSAAIASVTYQIVVRSGSRSLHTLTGSLAVAGAPFSGANPTGTAAVSPTSGRGISSVRLPGQIDDISAGAGGRYLILQMKKLHKLAIFDVSRREVVKYLSIDSDNFVFGAGADKLLVLLPDRKLIQRWSLKTFTLELTVPGLEDGRTNSPAIGYSSNGPAVFQCGQKTVFLDLQTLQPIKMKEENRSQMAYFGTQYRAGAQSGTYGSWYDGLTPTMQISLTLHDTVAQYRENFDSMGYIIPNADGSLLMTGKGLFTPDLRGVDTEKFDHIHCVPAYSSAFFLGIREANGKGEVSIYSASERRLLLTLPRFEEVSVPGGHLAGFPRLGLTFEKWWHFYPDLGLMITVPDNRDQLVLREINVMNALTQAGSDYLFVTSTPPTTFQAGQGFRYQVEVKARRGPAHLHLESGPAGMTLTPGGLLTWNVPAHSGDKEETVVITIKDAAGQSIFHTFKIAPR